MYTFSVSQPMHGFADLHQGRVRNLSDVLLRVGAVQPGRNPGRNQASSATQFCRQCHFTGAGGANEGSGIMGITTKW